MVVSVEGRNLFSVTVRSFESKGLTVTNIVELLPVYPLSDAVTVMKSIVGLLHPAESEVDVVISIPTIVSLGGSTRIVNLWYRRMSWSHQIHHCSHH